MEVMAVVVWVVVSVAVVVWVVPAWWLVAMVVWVAATVVMWAAVLSHKEQREE